ncbi:hypothetical protein CDAR_534581 [Caerostris darwini]|uniref:Uncharacterized protein n=1 Tax=Caerostris darwini TaxID=1538125 RepID=A0AAV4MLN1_9ARAC|nr:hypothetical protein CDAR_534581 [Caerostris darwini]
MEHQRTPNDPIPSHLLCTGPVQSCNARQIAPSLRFTSVPLSPQRVFTYSRPPDLWFGRKADDSFGFIYSLGCIRNIAFFLFFTRHLLMDYRDKWKV